MMEHLSKMNMTECYELSCYEQPEYDSDYDSEYDSDDKCSTRKRIVLGPLQLAPKKCNCIHCNWNGEQKECEQKWVTLNQMREHYNNQMKLKCLELQVETSTSIAKMQAEHSSALKALEEQSILVLSQHNAFMATLPKETKAGRERRKAEKKKAHQEKMSRQVHKTGGFKKRVIKEIDPEVIKARRASRRKVSKDAKKEAEAERVLTFASEKVVEEVVAEEVVTEEVVAEEVVAEEVVEVFKYVDLVLQTRPTQVKKSDDEENWQQVKSRKKQPTTQPTTQSHQPIRTQMCESVASEKCCRHGDKCRFAHNVTELVFPVCSFGNNCNNVIREGNGVYSSVRGKMCNRSHPGETKESVCARVGITIPKVVEKIVKFSSVYMPTLTGVKSSNSSVPHPNSAWQKKIKIEPDATFVTKPVVVVKKQVAPEVKICVSTSETSRAVAFAALANPKSLDNNLLRSQMCDSVSAKKACRHGSSCRFAHSISELVFPSCLFGESCKHVEYQCDGVYNNVRGKSCNRIHPYETKASICSRSEIKVDSAPLVKPEPLMTTVPVVLTQETVLRVPKEFVIQAMELAMKSGKTNIRVEIV